MSACRLSTVKSRPQANMNKIYMYPKKLWFNFAMGKSRLARGLREVKLIFIIYNSIYFIPSICKQF